MEAMKHGSEEEERPLVTVDVVIFTLREGSLQVLLVRRRRPPWEDMWAIPGGMIGREEALEAAALRTLEEETGLGDVFLEQLYTFGDPGRDARGRVITVSYFAVVPASNVIPWAAEDAVWVRWWPIGGLIGDTVEKDITLALGKDLQNYKLEYTAVGFELLPEVFTLSELQSAYENVLGEELDKRNFRRKIQSAGVIEPSGSFRAGEGRPAQLYRYREDAVAEVKARRLFP